MLLVDEFGRDSAQRTCVRNFVKIDLSVWLLSIRQTNIFFHYPYVREYRLLRSLVQNHQVWVYKTTVKVKANRVSSKLQCTGPLFLLLSIIPLSYCSSVIHFSDVIQMYQWKIYG